MEEVSLEKKYVVRLSSQKRETLPGVSKGRTGSSQKVWRAQILLKADIREPN